MKKRRHKALTNIGLRREIARAVLLSITMNFMVIALILILHIYYENARAAEIKNMQILFQKVEMMDSLQKGLLMDRQEKSAEDKPIATAANTFLLSKSEKEYIIRTCMAEAGADYAGCLAVAQCIHDRAVLWNKSPYEIVTAHRQFAAPRQGELYPASVAAVSDVFEKGVRAFKNANVTHFYSGDNVPYWTVSKSFIGEVGGNKFYI